MYIKLKVTENQIDWVIQIDVVEKYLLLRNKRKRFINLASSIFSNPKTQRPI